MTRRERNLFVVLLGILALGAVVLLVYFRFVVPLRDYNREIAGLADEKAKRQSEVDAILEARLLLENAKARSLPANPVKASADFDRFLVLLLKDCGLTEVSVTGPGPGDIKAPVEGPGTKKPGHIVLSYKVGAKGTLASLVAFLEKLRRTPVLQRVKTLSLHRDAANRETAKEVNGNKLTIQMTVEALILHNVKPDQEPTLKPDMLAALPSEKNPRRYGDIAGKNIFVGPLPLPPTPAVTTTDEGPDVREFIRLVSTDTTAQEAFLRNLLFNARETRLKTNPKSGYNTFRVTNEDGDRVILKGTVLRIDQRDLYFQVDEDVYALQIGYSLADAMRHRLTTEELENLGLLDLVQPVSEKKDTPGKTSKTGKKNR